MVTTRIGYSFTYDLTYYSDVMLNLNNGDFGDAKASFHTLSVSYIF